MFALALCIAAGLVGTPGPAHDVLVPRGAEWRYFDAGSLPAPGWMDAGYDDSGWSAGPAPLGYGDDDEATLVSYGPDPDAKYITTWFRRSFSAPAPSGQANVHLWMLCDDGAVVYLNGVEIARFNLPAGAIADDTPATIPVGGVFEKLWQLATLPVTVLSSGENLLAVEVHQVDGGSSDIRFDCELLAGPSEVVTRGPYLQIATPEGVTVRWRTNAAVVGRVWYGPTGQALTATLDESQAGTEHELTLSGLAPASTYAYVVGHTGGGAGTPLTAGDAFTTAPLPGAAAPRRVWVVGDSGTANPASRAVRDAFLGWNGGPAVSAWLMLGDNAYETGSADEYQAAVFDTFASVLRRSPLWPARGNHDMSAADYFGNFTLPDAAQAGGQPSGTEAWYSFDLGDAHFVCLDSYASDRSVGGPMWTWLQCDLAASTAEWLLAYWHHPPYTQGSHDSDVEAALAEMRANFLPMLEAGGVDLVLCGHSHAYERSVLIDGHYGTSDGFGPANVKQAGGGPYGKLAGPREGAIYVVAGSSGKLAGGPFDHPALPTTALAMGSCVVDLSGPQLDVRFLDAAGAVVDEFRIVHTAPVAWSNVGNGLPGGAGVPVLGAEGTLLPASPLTLTLCRAPGSTHATLIVGFALAGVPFKGGILVPQPDLLVSGLATSATGTLVLSANWPTGVAPGARLWVQAWMADPAGAAGLCASNAIVGTAH